MAIKVESIRSNKKLTIEKSILETDLVRNLEEKFLKDIATNVLTARLAIEQFFNMKEQRIHCPS